MQRKCHSTSSRRQGPVFPRRREAEGSETSVNLQTTARLEACGMIVGCSEMPPASVDVLSPSVLPLRGPESDLKRSPETPAGALKLPFPRTKSSQTQAGLRGKESWQGSPGSVSLMDWERTHDAGTDAEGGSPKTGRHVRNRFLPQRAFFSKHTHTHTSQAKERGQGTDRE